MNNIGQKKQPLVVITGPTATGKSALSVEIVLALKDQGIPAEIISADSRQVYRGLDIGSAKITKTEMSGIPHYMIDVADPSDIFSVANFQSQTKQVIDQLHLQGILPIIVGGTGMYISAIVDDTTFPDVPPNPELRAELEKLSADELFKKLEDLDFDRSETIDRNNPARMIRSIEIATALGSVPTIVQSESPYNLLMIGLELSKEELQANISERIVLRIPGIFDEIKRLLNSGVSPERMDSFGLDYRYGLQHVQGTLKGSEFIEALSIKTWQFAKRQMVWWKKDSRIHWFNPIVDKQKILQLVQVFSRLK